MTRVAGRLRVVHSGDSLEIVADLERRQAEVLAVELRALARRYGARIRSVQVQSRQARTGKAPAAARASG